MRPWTGQFGNWQRQQLGTESWFVALRGARARMAVRSVFILNKAGGLVYHRDFGEGLRRLADANDYLVIAGTFHSVHALTSRIAPTSAKSSGLQTMEMGGCTLHCFQTLTGLKFLVITDRGDVTAQAITQQLYELYAAYVMKNPFYTLDMPIRCAKFDQQLEMALSS